MAKNIGRKTTGSPVKSAKINKNLMRNATRRVPKTGHQYIFKELEADERYLNNRGDRRITITLIDLTDNEKVITRRGVAEMIGNSGALWLDSLEGHKKVYVHVSDRGDKCEVVKKPGSIYYSLDTVY